MYGTIRILWQWPMRSNNSLNILQLWASGHESREPILIKFVTQPQVKTTIRVKWISIKDLKKCKLQTAAMLGNIQNTITRLPLHRLRRKVGGHIIWHTRHVHNDAVGLPWQRTLPSNNELYIQQLWVYTDRTHKPFFITLGNQKQIITTITVSWYKIFFKIKYVWRQQCWKIFDM